MEAVSIKKVSDLKPEYMINRELSWLEFNRRVLDEAVSPYNPVFEKMRFLSIVASNFDEFFMVRVASVWEQHDAGYYLPDASGLTPRQQLTAIYLRVRKMLKRMYEILHRDILPELAVNGIRFLDIKAITPDQDLWLQRFFDSNVYPVITPMAVDATRPFPLIFNRSLNLGLLIEDETPGAPPMFATVQVPSGLSRVIRLPGKNDTTIALLEQVILHNIERLFEGRKVLCCHPYRITRNADLTIDEEDAEDLLKVIQESLRKRRWGAAVRLEIDYRADERLVSTLKLALELEEDEVYPIHGPINIDFLLRDIYGMPGFDALRYRRYTPRPLNIEQGESMLDLIVKRDLLLHHPYDSFDPTILFVKQAARDPKVLAIKQTLYRVSSGSPILGALIEAAESGKQVTALMELKARFDEENNIHWGKRLEQAGAHVIYGMLGFKTHSKITLVVRNEADGIRRYVHLSTGNYNEVTARIYTDHGLFTANDIICKDASAFFNMLTGYTDPPRLTKLISAPRDLRNALLALIDRETESAKKGKKGEMFAKMNSLVDDELIAALYRASIAGVKIKLLVRGMCCLRPGIKGISENIRVRSIVGRYLEHSRVFIFHAEGRQDAYLSSADWMPRNLDRRVELMFPIEDSAAKQRLIDLLKLQWRDNIQSRELKSDGQYVKLLKEGEQIINSQEELMKRSG
jgi:polyphosphate kinase